MIPDSIHLDMKYGLKQGHIDSVIVLYGRDKRYIGCCLYMEHADKLVWNTLDDI